MSEAFPLYYFGRTKGNTDRHEIEARLSVFTDEHRALVAEKYSSKFRNQGRSAANLWLHRLAVKYRKQKRRALMQAQNNEAA